MKQDTLTIRSSAIPSHDEWAELARVYEYQDATRKFSTHDLLKFWIAAAIWRRVMEWISSQRKTTPDLSVPDFLQQIIPHSEESREIPYEMIQKILQTLIERTSRNVRRTLSVPFPISIPLPSRSERGDCHGPVFKEINLGLSYTSAEAPLIFIQITVNPQTCFCP